MSQIVPREDAPVVVAGAGLAGISAAHHLRPNPVVLFDREKEPGGTARSYQEKGFTFDHTGHLLHLHQDYTRRLVRRLLGDNVVECQRRAWIYSHGVYTRYPFQANLYGLPAPVIEECYAGLWEARRKYGADPLAAAGPLSFAEWCGRLFGDGISRRFMLPYNRKLWGVPPEEMTPEWCGQFVPRPALEEVLAGAVEDRTKAFGYNASFLYPKTGGIQALARAFIAGLQDVRLGVSLEKVLWRERKVRLSSGDVLRYSHLVSTLPLPELVRRLDPFPPELEGPLARLRWTSVLCVNVGVARPAVSDKSWIYFPEARFPFYRVGFPMNFTPHAVPRGCSSMYVEVSFRPEEDVTSPAKKASLWRKIRQGLLAAGLVRRDDVFPVVSFLPIRYAYVVYDAHRTPSSGAILEWLREKAHASSIGRYGAWKYSFMEEAILDGKKTAESLRSRP